MLAAVYGEAKTGTSRPKKPIKTIRQNHVAKWVYEETARTVPLMTVGTAPLPGRFFDRAWSPVFMYEQWKNFFFIYQDGG